MNYYKANMEICKALSKGDLVRGYWMEDDLFFVTPEGYYGFIIPKKEIIFDVSRVHILSLPVFLTENFLKPENEIKKTRRFFQAGKELCQQFDGNGYSVYIKKRFMNAIDGEIIRGYYQNIQPGKNMAKELVLATIDSRMGNDLKEIPVMAFCPISILAYDI